MSLQHQLGKIIPKKKKKTSGLPPGSIVYTGKKTDIPVLVNYIEYNQEKCKQYTGKKKNEVIIRTPDENLVQWYDIRGLHDTELIHEIGNTFHIHPVICEDVVDIYQRPKYMEYDDGHFIHFKSIHFDSVKNNIVSQSISIYFGKAFVLTFQEHEDDVFASLRQRIIHAKGRVRNKQADYLANAIIDIIVDQYFDTLEEIDQRILGLEEKIGTDIDLIDKNDIYDLKKKLTKFRKSVYPLREAVNSFSRSDSELIEEKNTIYIRDVYDHVVQIIDSIDNHRDILSSLQDLYLSELSMKMNKVMQFLTIITSIFVPLSFLAGLYGMNFQYIPELNYPYGYFILLGAMVIIAICMIYIFRRKNWF